MSKLLILNSSSNVALLVLKLAVAFFLTPVIVHALGNHDYGINEMVLGFIGYMGLLEIGMQPAVTRFVARYNATADKKELQRIFSSAIFSSALVGLFLALVLTGWAFSGARGLAPEGADSTRYIYFLLIVACQVLVSFPGNVVQSVHQGHHRYGLTNLVTAVNTLVGTTIIYLFLVQGYGLIALTLGNAIGITVKFTLLGLLLHKQRFGGYRFCYANINLKSLRELYGFGIKSFGLGIFSGLSRRTSPLVIGAVLGPATVVFYMIPFNLIGYLNNMVSAATLSFMPYFSNLHASGDKDRSREVFLASSRYMVGFSSFSFVSAALLGPGFLRMWMGPDYASGGAIVLYLVVAWAGLRNLNPFHGRILTGMDLHGALAKIRMVEAAAYLILSLVLIHFMSIEGVALSVLLAALLVEPVILRLVCRQIDLSISGYLRKIVCPSLLPVGVLSCFYLLILAWFPLTNYGSLGLAGLVGSLVYFSLFLLTGVSSEERRLGLSVLRGITGRLQKPAAEQNMKSSAQGDRP